MESSPSKSSGTANVAPNNTKSLFENLPTELKLEILELVPDLRTMRALVHASPSFHQVYVAERERTLPRLTLAELAERGIELPQHRDAILDYSVKEGYSSRGFLETFRSYYSQLASKGKVLQLKVRECIDLLNLSDVVCWWATDSKDVYCTRLTRRPLWVDRLLPPRSVLRHTYSNYIRHSGSRTVTMAYPNHYLNYETVFLVDSKELPAHTQKKESVNEGNTDRVAISVLAGSRGFRTYCTEYMRNEDEIRREYLRNLERRNRPR